MLYVHGLGPKPAADRLKYEWDSALFGASAVARTCMAYWADILHPSGQAKPAAADMPTDWEVEFQRQARIGRPAGGRQWRRWATAFVTRRLIPDVAAYFFRADVRAAIQARFAAPILADTAPCVVIAHSMGSIVAYDVLHALGDVVDVPAWVTLGSPLGFSAVQDYLPRPLIVPCGVRTWRNFADRLDPVALDRSLANEFEPAGSIQDALIVNRETASAAGSHPHSVTGYLRHPCVRSAVMQVLDACRGAAGGS